MRRSARATADQAGHNQAQTTHSLRTKRLLMTAEHPHEQLLRLKSKSQAKQHLLREATALNARAPERAKPGPAGKLHGVTRRSPEMQPLQLEGGSPVVPLIAIAKTCQEMTQSKLAKQAPIKPYPLAAKTHQDWRLPTQKAQHPLETGP